MEQTVDLRLVGLRTGKTGHEVVAVRQVAGGEFDNVTKAIGSVYEFVAHQSLYALCTKNFEELVASWAQVEERYRASSGEFSEVIGLEISKELNRRLLNYLATFRTFIDHWRTTLRRQAKSGGSASHLATFEGKLQRFLSHCFEFQFFWDYRNYVQHVGLPGLEVSLTTAMTSGVTPGVLRFGSVGIDRDSLLKTYHWKWAQKSLPSQPRRIDLFARTGALARCLKQLNSICTRANLAMVRAPFHLLVGICNEIDGAVPGGRPGIADFRDLGAERLDLKITWLPLDLLSEIERARAGP
jgi:hypothetical protein